MTPELATLCEQQLTSLRESGGLTPFESASVPLRESLPRVIVVSDFVRLSLQRDVSLGTWLVEGAALDRPLARGEMAERVNAAVAHEPDLAGFMAALRRQRTREMVRIAWRDLAGFASVAETLTDTSAFADAAIAVAVDYANRDLVRTYGEPRNAAGEAQPLVVLGMGKLGGEELNFSSDIDLIFLFPDKGATAGSRSIDNEDYFTRLGRLVIRLLGERTAEGIVFRVDMRLRPFGDSGPLAVSATFLDNYLQTHGRDWERYAWIKARAISGVDAYRLIQAESVRPFVYRRYLDFGVFESLREMKSLIEKEVARRDLAEHVKLGPGGIREIEFVVQAFQLIRAGQDRRLQTASLLAALPQLAGGKLLPARVAQELEAAYLFLRRLENRLQMLADQQTHTLPEDSLTRSRIAYSMGTGAMGATSWEVLAAELALHRARVTRAFQEVVFARNEAALPDMPGVSGIVEAWVRGAETPQFAAALGARGFREPDPAAALLIEFRGGGSLRRLDAPGRARLDTLIPRLLGLIADLPADQAPSQADVLRRVLRVLEAIGSRSAYFALLNEHPQVRRKLVDLAALGEFLAAQIASHPLLLDELLGDGAGGLPPARAELEAEVTSRLAHLAEEEPERQVEVLRQFQRAAIFRVAMADLTGRIPLMRVSDYLTEIAEIIVEQAMQLAWRQMTAQFGVPHYRSPNGSPDSARHVVKICAVGYGKLGGYELGYASDLDLVFLHDSGTEGAETDAAKPVDNQVFFIRFAQRAIHLLTMHSAAGRLYEVDVRLRPSGKGGMLITRIGAFVDYQQKDAWTWEHQALLHARAVAGDRGLRDEFERIRLDLLGRCVRRDTLRDEVRNMRERMRRELSRARGSEKFDIKQDSGGTADIEFLAQYWALLHVHTHPPVAMFADTIRQLESVASADLVPQATVDVLVNAYRGYRERAHHLSLENAEPIVPAGEFAETRAAVTAIWNATMGHDG